MADDIKKNKIEREVNKFVINDLEQMQAFLAAITEMTQPLYIYTSVDDDIRKIVVSTAPMKDIEVEQAFEDIISKQEVEKEDETIWEDGEEIPDDWLLL